MLVYSSVLHKNYPFIEYEYMLQSTQEKKAIHGKGLSDKTIIKFYYQHY